MELIEQYRPTSWGDVVGQDKALRQIDVWRKRGSLLGRKLWLSGKSGTGKTTIARLIAAEFADPMCVSEFNAKDMTTTAIVEAFRALEIAFLKIQDLFQSGERPFIGSIDRLDYDPNGCHD